MHWNTLCLGNGWLTQSVSPTYKYYVFACSSVDDRYASLRETASTHSVLSVGVSCFQREDEAEVDKNAEGRVTWSVSTFSILLLSQVNIICVEMCDVSCMQGNTLNFTHIIAYLRRQCEFCSISIGQ